MKCSLTRSGIKSNSIAKVTVNDKIPSKRVFAKQTGFENDAKLPNENVVTESKADGRQARTKVLSVGISRRNSACPDIGDASGFPSLNIKGHIIG